MGNRDKKIIYYMVKNWKLVFLYLFISAISIYFGAYHGLSSPFNNLLVSFGVGVLASVVYSTFSDYQTKMFFVDVLDDHNSSLHSGVKVHRDHRNLKSRRDALLEFFTSDDVLQIQSVTADDYLRDQVNLEIIRDRLNKGARLELLLYTPLLAFGSGLSFGKEFQTHGQRRLATFDLILEQVTLFAIMDKLLSDFPQRVEIKFFSIPHHVNMIIYGNSRIYSAPILRGTQGIDLPCIELFPGVLDDTLFRKYRNEFLFHWESSKLTFSYSDILAMYQSLMSNTSFKDGESKLDYQQIKKVENEAIKIMAGYAENL